MSQIHPGQTLLDEHRVIEGVLNAFEARLLKLPSRPIPGQWLTGAMDFFRHFVEACHHNKEEELVFPRLRESGLLAQHDTGAEFLDRLEQTIDRAGSGEPRAVEDFGEAGLAYVRFLREHIRQEDEILHWAASQPMSDVSVEQFQQEASPEQFHQMSEETYEKYVALAERLGAAEAA